MYCLRWGYFPVRGVIRCKDGHINMWVEGRIQRNSRHKQLKVLVLLKRTAKKDSVYIEGSFASKKAEWNILRWNQLLYIGSYGIRSDKEKRALTDQKHQNWKLVCHKKEKRLLGRTQIKPVCSILRNH